jgi:hypothetical protein
MLETIKRQRFKKGIMARDVDAGKYEFYRTNRTSDITTATSRLIPGTAITMAVIVVSSSSVEPTCPIPRYGSLQASECPGRGYTWYVRFHQH